MPKTALWFRADNLDNFAEMRFFPGLFNRSVKLKVYMYTHKKPLVPGRFLLSFFLSGNRKNLFYLKSKEAKEENRIMQNAR